MSSDGQEPVTNADAPAAAGLPRQRGVQLGFVLALAASAPAAVALLRHGGTSEPAADPSPELPLPDARCSAAPAGHARRAREAAAAATAAIERYPFDASEGLVALDLLHEAGHCFALAGEPSARAESAARAAAWRARLQRDCRDRFLRYRIARASGRLEHALEDVEFLIALCAPDHGALAARLRRERIEITDRNQDQEAP